MCGIVLGSVAGLVWRKPSRARCQDDYPRSTVARKHDRSYLHPLQFFAAAAFGFASVIIGRMAARERCGKNGSGRGAEPRSLRRTERKPRVAMELDGRGDMCCIAWRCRGLRYTPTRGCSRSSLPSVCSPASRSSRIGHRALCRIGRGLCAHRVCRLAAENLARSCTARRTVAAWTAAIAIDDRAHGHDLFVPRKRQRLDRPRLVADLSSPRFDETIGLSAAIPPRAIAWLEREANGSGPIPSAKNRCGECCGAGRRNPRVSGP